jgi:hypothetical protein
MRLLPGGIDSFDSVTERTYNVQAANSIGNQTGGARIRGKSDCRHAIAAAVHKREFRERGNGHSVLRPYGKS